MELGYTDATWKVAMIKHPRLSVLAAICAAGFVTYSHAEESSEPHSPLFGSLGLAYDTNIYHKDDHRSVRSFSWHGDLGYKLEEQHSIYIRSGGYRALEDEVGTYALDTVAGWNYSNWYEFEGGSAFSLNTQLTIPTSETSRKDELITSLRVAVPYKIKAWDVNFSVSPRLRKNFHRYKTAGGKSLTEWVYSLSLAASYQWNDFTFGLSALGGNTISYQGTRRSSFNYAGSAYASYRFTDNWSASLSGSTSGFYSDAERGTLGNIDLFDPDLATYTAQITFSF